KGHCALPRSRYAPDTLRCQEASSWRDRRSDHDGRGPGRRPTRSIFLAGCPVRKPFGTTREPRRRNDVSVTREVSELFLQAPEDSSRRAELLREDSHAGTVAEHVVLAQHIDDIEPGFHLAQAPQLESMRDAEVDLLVRRVARVVRVPDGAS